VEPCGFPLDDKKMKRAAMDYAEKARLVRHHSWGKFTDYHQQHAGRLLLLETDGAMPFTDWHYQPQDYVLLGSESAGTPRDLYRVMDATLHIPMRKGARSLNVSMAAGMLVAEAARQQGWKF